MVQEPDPRAYGDLLCGGELRGMFRAWFRDDSVRGGGGGCEMRGGFVGGECAAVEGEGDLDFGFVGRAGNQGGSLGGHFVFVFSFLVSCCIWYGFGGVGWLVWCIKNWTYFWLLSIGCAEYGSPG